MGTEDKNLTPEQSQSQAASQIQARFTTTDQLERFSAKLGFFGFDSGPGGFFGKTDFENAPLNAMLDLLEAANPSDLEAAGTALEAARKALNDAARDLKKDAAAVELKGEAGTEFQRFAADLATYTYNLASFANVVGAQMKVASTGLASVRNARPPRDNRPDPKKPTDFPVGAHGGQRGVPEGRQGGARPPGGHQSDEPPRVVLRGLGVDARLPGAAEVPGAAEGRRAAAERRGRCRSWRWCTGSVA